MRNDSVKVIAASMRRSASVSMSMNSEMPETRRPPDCMCRQASPTICSRGSVTDAMPWDVGRHPVAVAPRTLATAPRGTDRVVGARFLELPPSQNEVRLIQ